MEVKKRYIGGTMMQVTIKDIARECGVSVATVSMALSSKKTRISEKTKAKVVEVAKKYNYQPNNAAVSLVNKKSKLIGIVFNDLRNTHISSLFMEINNVIEKKGYALVCHIIEDDEIIDCDLIKNVGAGNISALIWAKSLQKYTENEKQKLNDAIVRLGVPVITMERYGFTCRGTDVVFDYRQGGDMATKHLIEYGHKRIGCVAGKKNFQVTRERLEGYKMALQEAGIPYDEELVVYGDYTMNSGYQALSYIMGKKVTAIFSMNDEMAFGVYRAARMYGVKIPEDVSIVGFDNVPFADVMQVPLTTVHIPVEEMGKYIGERTMELIEGAEEQGRNEREYKPQLLLRGSTRKI